MPGRQPDLCLPTLLLNPSRPLTPSPPLPPPARPRRTFAQLVLWRLLELLPALPRSDQALASMLGFFSTNEDIRRLRAGLGPGLDSLERCLGTTPRAVLGQVWRAASLPCMAG